MSCNYSIIIPHYNIPELLKRCLASIPQREDTEVIIIDDNSSPKIVDLDHFPGYNRQDVTIFFLKSNRGGGYARNIGLSLARGKNVIFADADDFFNNCFSEVLDNYVDKDFDVVYLNANSVDTDSLLPSNRALLLNSWMNIWSKKHKNFDDFKYRFGEPWGKIINRQLIVDNDLKFDETPIHNDTTFSYMLGFHAKKIDIDTRKLYCITTRKKSTSTIVSEKNCLTRIWVFARQEIFFKQHSIDVQKDEHFAELLRLLYFKCSSFWKGFYLMKYLGFSKCSIIWGLLRQLAINIKYSLIK